MTAKLSVVLLVAALAGTAAILYVLLQPAAQPEPTAALAPAPKAVAGPVTLEVRKGQRVKGPALIQRRAGETITLRITSDQADELHLHGYDLHLHLHAGVPAELSFTADRSGRFEYELHKSGLHLGVLEVQPQ